MGNFESLALLIAIFAVIWAFERKNFTRDGLLLLRRTKRGLLAIDAFAKRHSNFLEKYADAGVVASFGLLGVKYLAKQKKYSAKARVAVALKYAVLAGLLIFLLPEAFTGILSTFNVPAAYIKPILYSFIALSFVFGLAGYSFFMLAVAGIGSTLAALAGTVPQSALKLVLPFSVPEKYAYLPVQEVPIVPWLISIFVILVAHEFSHAIIARREGIRVKSLGYGFLAILPLGFAEPDENQIERAPSLKKTRIFAAGSWSNIVTGVLVILLSIPFIIGYGALQEKYTFQAGIGYSRVDSNITANILPPKGVITELNGMAVHNFTDYQSIMAHVSPGDALPVMVDGTRYNFFAQADQENKTRAIAGFLSKDLYVQRDVLPEKKGTVAEYLLVSINYVNTVFQWIVMLSIGIALANLLPIKPLDGGLMMEEAASVISPRKPKKLARTVSMIALLLLLYTLFGPMLLKALM